MKFTKVNPVDISSLILCEVTKDEEFVETALRPSKINRHFFHRATCERKPQAQVAVFTISTPFVFGVASFEFFFDCGISTFPKIVEVLRDLNRAAVGREQFKCQRKFSLRDV